MDSSEDVTTNDLVDNEDILRIINLISQGEEKISFSEYEKAVVILGNTGSGKSTFAQLVSNNYLYSKEVMEGSGEFLILDNENKISVDSTILSETTFPEMMIDEEKIAYIDCPGFNDTRNEAYDIATSYFIANALRTVEAVKFVLVVSYPSLRKGVSRDDFTRVLKHFTNIIKNIEKYADGIVLIATKVDNSYIVEGDFVNLVRDDIVIENIAFFLKEVRETFKQMLDNGSANLIASREQDIEYIHNSLKLIDLLLTEKHDRYDRIGIFRRPNKNGALSGIPNLQKNKTYIKNLLQSNVRYVNIDTNDIGITVSDKSAIIIRDLAEKLNKEICVEFSTIGSDLIEYYKSEEHKQLSNDMHSLIEKLRSGNQFLCKLEKMDYSSDAEQLAKEIFVQFKKAGVRIPSSPFQRIFKLSNVLKFLENLSSNKLNLEFSKWFEQLLDTHSYVKNSELWYAVMERVYERLGEYEIRTKFDNQTVPVFKNVIANEDDTILLEKITELTDFIDELKGDDDWLVSIFYQPLKKIRLNNIKLQYLDAIIEITMREKSITNYYKKIDLLSRVEIVGEYVKLSEIIYCDWTKTTLQIYAKHTVFIDTDLNDMCDVCIVARRWKVVGNREISLKRPSYLETSSDCSNVFKNHGHFFGIGCIFENVENLRIVNPGSDQDDYYGAVEFINLSENKNMFKLINKHDPVKMRYDVIGSKTIVPKKKFEFFKKFFQKSPKSSKLVSIDTYSPVFTIDHQPVEIYSRSILISKYRKYISNDLRNFIEKRSTLKFYSDLWKHTSLKTMDGDTQLLDELEEVEKNYNVFDSDVKQFFYDSFLTRFKQIVSPSDCQNNMIHSKIKRKLFRLNQVSENWLITSRTFFDDLFALLTPFNAESAVRINLFYNDIADKYLGDVQTFLYSNVIFKIEELFSSNDKRIIELVQSPNEHTNEITNAFLRRSILKCFAKISPLLRFVYNWLELEMDFVEKFHISDNPSILCNPHRKFNRALYENQEPDMRILDELHESQLKYSNSLKTDYIVSELAEERQLLMTKGFCYKQCKSLLLKQIELTKAQDNGHLNLSNDEASMIYDEINEILKPLVEDQMNMDVLKICNQSRLYLIFPESDKYMFEKVRDMNEQQIAVVLDRLTGKIRILGGINNDISKICELLPTAKTLEQNNDYFEETVPAEILQQIEAVTSTFSHKLDLEEDLNDIKHNIHQGVSMLANVLKVIPTYKNRKILNANMGSDPFVKRDLVLYEYEKLIQTYKHYMFFQKGINFVPKNVVLDSKNNGAIPTFFNSLLSSINVLKTQLNSNLFQNSRDFSVNTSTGPFFTWKYSSHEDAISQLLNGKEISLTSVIPKNAAYELVKFSKIRLSFILLEDHKLQESSFRQTLENFEIIMTHSGTSYYSFSGSVYWLDQPPTTISYNFSSTSYAVIENKFELSPYTRWKFQLQPNNPMKSWKILMNYRECKFDLQLEGYAECIPARNEINGEQPFLPYLKSYSTRPQVQLDSTHVSTVGSY